jgi:hypothetical protein
MYHAIISLWNAFGRLMPTTPTGAGADEEEKTTASQLFRLPPEIILLVADKLSTSSAACFALCSRHLSHIVRTGFWKSLQSEAPDVQLAFPASLARDLPQHFVC